ncbi:hydroxymethylbilane synthase [Microbacterium terrae]|uniref:Porphobilinogen deaminase n=1 Tax=Microbacterium terrae TaxID=69369 RepID=A0A0M2H612_9MICO|nr:hydroxymethylbilane synthase [Microbacterium terrae]KJL39295.1 Porphobilinogen deaminase [Microbacterium terrae]MBP1076772.1 hydroxymethylbilane synthase [Microbacterium terrae]GLJ99366.1 porphobilinogen deaminase 1 [Microbacterium terrae]
MTTLRIGTRGSALALTQTGMVAADLADATGVSTELVTITTDGDRSNEPLSRAGGAGLFTGALRDALLADECDVIVHSLKDLPTAPHDRLIVAAIPSREDPRDALCARDGLTLETLPAGARVGTGSPRRMAQLRARRPDLEVVDIRGNVETRLGRVAPGDLDAVVLAGAGLRRLGRTEVVTDWLDADAWPTAPGQGALAIEVRRGDEDLVRALDHAETRAAVEAERHVLALLEAGCSAPVGARAVVDAGLLLLSASVYSLDGTVVLTSSHAASWPDADAPHDVGAAAARELLDAGAADLTGARP